MTSMPASRNVRATILTPRSCPSSPTLATSTRSVTRSPATGSGARSFDPCPEFALERANYLAERCVRTRRFHQGRHQVHGRVRRVGAHPLQRGGDLLGVACLP